MSEEATPSDAVIDVEQLLQPISEESAVGADPSDDAASYAAYYQLKDARNGARAAERSAEIEGEDLWTVSRQQWLEVIAQAPPFLAERAKHLEVAAWLTEALVREHGFRGLRDGLRLLLGLVNTYGDDIHPLPDEDGLETRVAPVSGLNGVGVDGTLIAPINAIPLTQGSSVGPFSAWQFTQAQEMEGVTDPEERARRIEGGAVTMGEFQTAVGETDPSFLRSLRTELDEAIAAWEELTAAMDERWGADAPPTSNIKKALAHYHETFDFATRDILVEESEDGGDEAGDGDGEGSGGGSGGGAAGAIRGREDALRELAKVAEYFRRAEPHSPISYALQRLVRWGRMPLPELYAELIDDSTARESLFRLTGIDAPPGESEY